MKGLMIALGKPGKGDDEDMKGGPARQYAREAYSALQDKDEDGFVEALLSLKACSDESSEEEDEEG